MFIFKNTSNFLFFLLNNFPNLNFNVLVKAYVGVDTNHASMGPFTVVS